MNGSEHLNIGGHFDLVNGVEQIDGKKVDLKEHLKPCGCTADCACTDCPEADTETGPIDESGTVSV